MAAQLQPQSSPLAPASPPASPPNVDSILAAQPKRLEELNEDVADTDKKVADISAKEGAMKMPELKEVPQATAPQTDPAKIWGSSAMLFAALGGLMTRRPLVTAMNAATKVFQAYKQNDIEAAKTAFDSWKIANENAMKIADFQQKQYKEALDGYEKDKTGALASLRAKMVAFQDTTGVQQLDIHGIQGAEQHILELKRLNNEITRTQADLEEKNDQHQALMGARKAQSDLKQAQASGDPAKVAAAKAELDAAMENIHTINAAYGKGGAAAQSAGDFTPKMGQLMAALAEKGVSLPAGMRSRAQQIQLYQGILDRNQDKSPDEIADMVKKGQIEFGAQKKETQTAAGIAGKVEVAANELKEFVPLVRQASADLKRSNLRSLNELVQMGDEQISDPTLKKLKGYIVGTLNAYDVLAARGGTDAEKRAENRKQLLSAEGDRAINAALDVIQKESDIAHKASVEATRVPELGDTDNGPGKVGGKAGGDGKRGAATHTLRGKPIWPSDDGTHWVFEDGSEAK